MKRKLVLLSVVFLIALTVALPVALPTSDDVVSGSGDAVTARVMDFTTTFNYDPECPPPTQAGGGC